MKRVLLILVLAIIPAVSAFASTQAHLTRVGQHATHHHAHKAGKHHAPKHHHHAA